MSKEVHDVRELVAALGGPATVSRVLTRRVGRPSPLRPHAVTMWARRGVPWRWRHAVAALAAERGVDLPAGYWEVRDGA